MITQQQILEFLQYDEKSGALTWVQTNSNRTKVGSVAGNLTKNGYIELQLLGKRFYAHRLIWMIVYGEFPTHHIDHINHDRADNKIDNLRDVSIKENAVNKKLRSDNTSGFYGISWTSRLRKWTVSIQKNKKTIFLGNFSCKHEAVKARRNAELEYGFHVNHGN